jgi:hypothetical protein
MFAGIAVTLCALPQHERNLPEIRGLHATGNDTGASMSMATGLIDDGMEGVFFLDFVTGKLGCMVLNQRGGLGGVFTTDVIKDLALADGKKPAYLMVTGLATFTGNQQVARSVVYVCDQNTGNFAVYALPWNRTLAAQNKLQQGALTRLIAENARPKTED